MTASEGARLDCDCAAARARSQQPKTWLARGNSAAQAQPGDKLASRAMSAAAMIAQYVHRYEFWHHAARSMRQRMPPRLARSALSVPQQA
jgi:hypothetical protein